MRQRPGFTFLELLVVLAIVAILLTIFIPYAQSWREANRRVQCLNNLGQIRAALWAYGDQYGKVGSTERWFPRVRYDEAALPEGYRAYTGADDPDPFAADSSVLPNDVTASLWLLVRTKLITDTGVFVCPSSSDSRDLLVDAAGRAVDARQRGNFRLPENLSYGYAHPFGNAPDYRLVDTLPGGFVLMADKSPGTGRGAVLEVQHDEPIVSRARANTRNHGGAGQNVLYADGSVRWRAHVFVGVGLTGGGASDGDNIFTALASTPIISGTPPPANAPGVFRPTVVPAWNHDTLLVPTDDDR